MCEKDVEAKLLDVKIEYLEKQRSRLWGKQAKSSAKILAIRYA